MGVFGYIYFAEIKKIIAENIVNNDKSQLKQYNGVISSAKKYSEPINSNKNKLNSEKFLIFNLC